MSGHTRHAWIRNECIKERAGVRLKWFGLVRRRPVEALVKRVD